MLKVGDRAPDFEALDDRRGVGKCLNNLAGIYRALGQDTKSADSFRQGSERLEGTAYRVLAPHGTI